LGLSRFLPRDERFFDHFGAAADNARDAALLLHDLFERYDDVERKVRRLRDIEHRGDEITHRILSALNSTFVTPLDREDIQHLTSRLDDFVDCVEEAGGRMWLYRIEKPTSRAVLLARIVAEQSEVLAKAVPMLRDKGAATELRYHIVEVHRLENEADEVFDEAMASLYDGAADIPSMVLGIRWGEVYGLLEDATDGAEDVADALEGILLKNA
jgi:predicted phosphate transport protein (TIGR00153 family)